jgi:hypothetical protein
MRTNTFLKSCLQGFLEDQFADMPVENRLTIAFGRRAKRRFGSIKMDRQGKESWITINGVFRDERIPQQIIYATVAHELCHYAHGFCSPLKKKYKYPHQSGVVSRELKKRGLHHLSEYEKIWTKNNWPKVLEREFPRQAKRRVRRRVGRKSGLKLVLDLLKP